MLRGNLRFSRKFHKIHREIPVLQSRPNTVKDLQAIRLANLLKRDPAPAFQNRLFVDPLQNSCS